MPVRAGFYPRMKLVRMTYAHPERLREGKDESGRRVVERIPSHATRPARPYELNCWYEPIAVNPKPKVK